MGGNKQQSACKSNTHMASLCAYPSSHSGNWADMRNDNSA